MRHSSFSGMPRLKFKKIFFFEKTIAIWKEIWYNIKVEINIRRNTQVGTFASAACGRGSEQKGVAAVEIW